MLKQHDISRFFPLHHILGTLHTGIVIIRHQRICDKILIKYIRIHGNNRNVCFPCLLQLLTQSRKVHRIDNQRTDILLNQIVNLFLLLLQIKCRVQGYENIPVCLDDIAYLIIDYIEKGIVQRHIGRPDFQRLLAAIDELLAGIAAQK